MMPNFILPKAMQQLADSIRGKSMHRQIQRVQMFFLRYGYSIDADKWIIRTPLELDAAGQGDCKAHAIAKYLVLLRAGVPMDSIRIVQARNAQGAGHMILLVGDRILDLQAMVYGLKNVPYRPLVGWNHETYGICENGVESWLGWVRMEDVIWDFNWVTYDNFVWRFIHRNHFKHWRKFNKKLEAEAEMQKKTFADQLKATPFERAVAEVGVIPDTRHVSPETEAEVQAVFAQAGGQISTALWGKLSARAQAEMSKFAQQNKTGLMAVANKLGVKL